MVREYKTGFKREVSRRPRRILWNVVNYSGYLANFYSPEKKEKLPYLILLPAISLAIGFVEGSIYSYAVNQFILNNPVPTALTALTLIARGYHTYKKLIQRM